MSFCTGVVPERRSSFGPGLFGVTGFHYSFVFRNVGCLRALSCDGRV